MGSAAQTIELLFDTGKAEKALAGLIDKAAGTGGKGGASLGGAIVQGITDAANAFGRGQTSQPFGADAGARSLAGFRELGTHAVSGALELIPGIGGALATMFKHEAADFSELADRPSFNAASRVGAIAGHLEAAGIRVDDRDIDQGLDVAREQERRRLLTERRVNAHEFTLGHGLDGLAFAWQNYRGF